MLEKPSPVTAVALTIAVAPMPDGTGTVKTRRADDVIAHREVGQIVEGHVHVALR